nr:hypothetical protein [uncultured Desulfuromonas sp.]
MATQSIFSVDPKTRDGHGVTGMELQCVIKHNDRRAGGVKNCLQFITRDNEVIVGFFEMFQNLGEAFGNDTDGIKG